MSDILVRGGFILTINSDWRSASWVDRSVAVAEHLEVQGVDVVDAAGCIVTPGFIDGHSNCWQSLGFGFHRSSSACPLNCGAVSSARARSGRL
jgi:predicted amidohydrolase